MTSCNLADSVDYPSDKNVQVEVDRLLIKQSPPEQLYVKERPIDICIMYVNKQTTHQICCLFLRCPCSCHLDRKC